MTFHKTANVQHLGTFTVDSEGHQKVAQVADPQTSYYMDGSAKVDVAGILKRVASQYNISDDPGDYVFEAIRANTTSVFNDNDDGFSREELLRFDPRLKTAVYLTYREKPHHVNHRTDNPKRARGVILDAHYNDDATPLAECPGCGTRTASRQARDKSGIFCGKCGTVVVDEFPEILVAVDAKKDPIFAEGVRKGQLRFGSMGCTCAETVCNVCDNVARSRSDFCTHIASHKGSYWSRDGKDDKWHKVSARQAEREFRVRGLNFHERDFVSMRAEDGYEVRRAAEWCQGVEFEEYSRVGLPADPKAEQREILNKTAAPEVTFDDLQSETTHLIAAARLNAGRNKKRKTAMLYHLVRIDGDPSDVHAADSLESAMTLANPDPGASIEVAQVEADDAGAARMMSDQVEFMPHDQADGMAVDGDVNITIQDSPSGETVGIDPPPEEDGAMPPGDGIEDLTEQVMDPEPQMPGDDEFTPEEVGVLPAGASKEAAAEMYETSYADWKVQVTPRGSAQVVSPRGPVAIIRAKKENPTLKEKKAFGQSVVDYLNDHGLFATMRKFDAAFHAKFASVVDHACDDMADFMDKDTKSAVSEGGDDDMGMGKERGQHAKDVRDMADHDHQEDIRTKVDDAASGRATDHELGDESRPDSSTENEGSDMEEERRKFTMSDSSLDDAAFDHAKLASKDDEDCEKCAAGDCDTHEHDKGAAFKNKKSGRIARVAKYDRQAQVYDLVDEKLNVTKVPQLDLVKMWMQIDKGPNADVSSRVAEVEARMRVWAKSEVERARKAATADVFRAIRIAAGRQAKGLADSPMKVALATEIANDKVVGHDAISKAPLEYKGMADELAIHLVEAAYSEASDREIDALLSNAAKLLKHDDSYLKSAEADLQRVAYRVPVVTASAMVDDLDREAEDLRKQATAGNMELSSSPEEAAPAASNGHKNGSIRAALGMTRAGARTQFRH